MAGDNGVSIQNECDYFLWLFAEHKVLMGEEKQLIWSLHWECELNGIPFTMVYDEDCGTVSFSVTEEHIADIDNLSRAIIDMINQETSQYCDRDHYCPVYHRQINGAVCYETVMAFGQYIKKDAVSEMKEIVDMQQGKKICDACPGNCLD